LDKIYLYGPLYVNVILIAVAMETCSDQTVPLYW